MKKEFRDIPIIMSEGNMDKLYNHSTWPVRFVHNGRLMSIIKTIPEKSGLKILDAGCGEGHLISKMIENNIEGVFWGVDNTEVSLKQAIKRCPSAEFKKGNIMRLDAFKDDFFDVVICTEVLEHILEYGKAIQELKRVLKKEGVLIVTFPNEKLWTLGRFFLGRRPVKLPGHVNSFTPEKIVNKVGLKCMVRRNLPFNLPFFFSLCALIMFQK